MVPGAGEESHLLNARSWYLIEDGHHLPGQRTPLKKTALHQAPALGPMLPLLSPVSHLQFQPNNQKLLAQGPKGSLVLRRQLPPSLRRLTWLPEFTKILRTDFMNVSYALTS